VRALLSTLLLLALWEAVATLGPFPRFLFPPVSEVAAASWRLLRDGSLLDATLKSLSRLGQGYALTAALGIPLGLLLARFPRFRAFLKPAVMGLQALPSITWLPLALLWFGLSESAILFVVVMGSLLAVAIATEDAVASIPPILLDVSGTLGIRGPRLYAGVLLPAALPGILTGLKLGWSFAWRALMAGELLFVSGGLGQLLTLGRDLLDVAQVLAVMLAIVAVGVAVDRVLFRTLEQRVRRRWGLVPTA
jgi:NitT/TauT family transport system permease protein